MRKSKFSESQIVSILKDPSGIAVTELLRKHGIFTFLPRRSSAAQSPNELSA